MAISQSSLTIKQSVVETIPANNALVATGTKVASGITRTAGRSPSTTPAVTAHGFGVVTLVAGAGSIDLTAMTGINGATVNGNGLKVRSAVFYNPGATNPITIAKGVANGYTGLGAAYSKTLPPGGAEGTELAAGGVTVGATNKILDVSGTLTDTLQYDILLG